jgi:hypothetical protein
MTVLSRLIAIVKQSYPCLACYAIIPQNAQAYFATAVSYECKMFMKLPPEQQVIHFVHLR